MEFIKDIEQIDIRNNVDSLSESLWLYHKPKPTIAMITIPINIPCVFLLINAPLIKNKINYIVIVINILQNCINRIAIICINGG